MKPEDRYVVIDVETAQSYDDIIEIAAVEIIGSPPPLDFLGHALAGS